VRLSPLSQAKLASGELLGASLLSGVTLSGAEVQVELGSPGAKALLFLTSSCYGCMPVWSSLRGISGPREVPDLRTRSGPSRGRRVIAVVPDPTTERPGAVSSLAPDWLEVVMSSKAWLELCPGPAPWLIAADGHRIAYSGSAPSSARKLRRLLRS